MIVQRWSEQDTYREPIERYARLEGVPLPLAYGTIAQESGFDPSAVRQEVQISDASYGLMQILSGTARGFGFSGSAAQLFDPETNLRYGMKALGAAYRRAAGNMANAASAYNGGYRPEYGFGVPASRDVTICARRNAAGNCTSYRTVTAGTYGNPDYVNGVLEKASYFAQYLEARDGIAQPPVTGLTAPPAEAGFAGPALYLAGGLGLLWLIRWAFTHH